MTGRKTMSQYEFYIVEKKPPLAWVFLNRPEKKNAMNPPAWKEIIPIFEDLDSDPEIRAVIIAGKGSCFSTGIDLMSMMGEIPEILESEQKGGTKWKILKKIRGLQETMTCIERCRKPVIAAIHGHCIGAGLDMVTACDIRICSKDAVFSLREAALGIVADVGVLQRLPHICGQGITRQLAFTAENVKAERAREILLVNTVFETPEELMEQAKVLATQIGENSPLAVQASKSVLNHGIGKSIDDGLQYVASISTNIMPSNDLTEAMTAFMEKRKPEFLG
jgi:Delta3,5-Delta2,4-dienoyl-CoA isomerase